MQKNKANQWIILWTKRQFECIRHRASSRRIKLSIYLSTSRCYELATPSFPLFSFLNVSSYLSFSLSLSNISLPLLLILLVPFVPLSASVSIPLCLSLSIRLSPSPVALLKIRRSSKYNAPIQEDDALTYEVPLPWKPTRDGHPSSGRSWCTRR